jgi:hypothetical protein
MKGCLQDDFGVDQDDVYEVVAAWNEHSEDVEAYVALQEESGMDARGLQEAVRQYHVQKDEYAQYEALRRDTGMDAEGMRKVGISSCHGFACVRASFQESQP